MDLAIGRNPLANLSLFIRSTEGERSPKWVAGYKARLRLHPRPFFGKMCISQITSGDIQNYRLHRAQQCGRMPAKDGEGAYVKLNLVILALPK